MTVLMVAMLMPMDRVDWFIFDEDGDVSDVNVCNRFADGGGSRRHW